MNGPGMVIAGAGMAACHAAASLRDAGYAGRITMIGDEAQQPYHRPPLSKAFLTGAAVEARLAMRPDSFYREREVEVLLGRRVMELDRAGRRALLDDGNVRDYEHFVFAVGARNRPLAIPGAQLNGVRYLRTLEDAQVLRAAMPAIKNAIVIGAGFIGLEFAAMAVKLGIAVTVLELESRPMARALSEPASEYFTREHMKSGMRLCFKAQLHRVLGEDGRVTGIELGDGTVLPADLVLVGIGVIPNTEIAAASGLEVSNGIVVDEFMATRDPAVSAIGDCAAHRNDYADGALIRLESVQNATDQARSLAVRMTGKPVRYSAAPWFWSDQGELKLQIAGLTRGHDQTVVREEAAGLTVFCFRAGRLLGVETVNRPADHMAARKLMTQRSAVTAQQAADRAISLKDLAAAA